MSDLIKRIRDLYIYDINNHKKYVNPEHARLYKLQEYSISWLYYYQHERRINGTKKYCKDFYLIQKFLKDLKTQIKDSQRLYTSQNKR